MTWRPKWQGGTWTGAKPKPVRGAKVVVNRPEQIELPGIDTKPRQVTPLSRSTVRRKGNWETATPQPWECVILAVDTARVSGWSLTRDGKYVTSGEVDTSQFGAVLSVCSRFCGKAESVVPANAEPIGNHSRPIVLVLESPWGGNVHVVAALGAARERWVDAWKRCDQSPGRVVKVTPNVWRGPVIGGRYARCSREQIRAQEQLLAARIVGRPCGPDEAPAVLIGQWASHARVVGTVIGKRAMRASVRAWEKARER
jgi:hypothetical protein